MAEITEPVGGWASHDEIYEFYNPGVGDDSNVTMDFEFGYTLNATEELVSCTLTSYPDVTQYGTTIDGLRAYGIVKDYFERQGVSLPLSIRNRKTLSITVVNGFDSLPTDQSVDVVKFAPPPPQTDTIEYTVTLVYDDKTDPLLVVRTTLESKFIQTIRGTYAAWAGKLQEYIVESGPFPDVEI